MKKLVVGLAVLAVAVLALLASLAGPASPVSALHDNVYTVHQPGMPAPVSITPLVHQGSTPDFFYDYDGACTASANTGLELSETSQLFLRDTAFNGLGGLSLVMIHDSGNGAGCLGDPPATGGFVDFAFTGVTAGATWLVRDDPNPPFSDTYVTPPAASASWGWDPCCTDGGAIGFLECPFTITITPNFIAGIDEWIARSGPGADIVTFPNLTEPITITCNQFTFCSGSANASFGPNGEGPTTMGLGAFGDRDPVTDHDVVTPLPGPATTYIPDAVIIEQNPGWGLVAGSQWISYGLTTFVGPPNSTLVTFTVNFILPAGATGPELKVTTIQDDNVDIYLNNSFEVNHAGHTQASQLTRTITGSPPFIPGNNQLRFDVEQTGGDGFGLDYCATVTFTPAPPSVGGTTELLVGSGSDSPVSPADGSGSSFPYAALAAAAAVAAIAVAGAGWYARRRLS